MPDSIHEHAEEWLAAALADGLSADERRALDAHLASCEPCRTLQGDLTMIDETLRQNFPLAVGAAPGFETRLVANFRGRLERVQPGARLSALLAWLVRLRGVQAASVAAVLLAMVGVGIWLTGTDQIPGRSFNAAKSHGLTEMPLFGFPDLVQQSKRAVASSGTVGGAFDRPGKDLEMHTRAASPSVFFGGKSGTETVALGEPVQELILPKEDPPSRSVAIDSLTKSRTTPTNFEKRSVGGTLELENGAKTYNPSGGFALEKAKDITLDQTRLADSRYGLLPSTVSGYSHVLLDQNRVDSRYGFSESSDKSFTTLGDAQGAAAGSSGSSDAPALTPAATPDARKLIRNASAELEVSSFEQTLAALTTAAAQDGGFIDTQNSAKGANGKVSGRLVVKVLPDNLDRFLARLRTLGEVKNQTIKTEDITKAYFDTEARLRNSRRMEERLLKMLEEVKGKMSEVLAVEKEIARVRGDIEQMQGELKLYDFQVGLATVSLNVYEKDLHQAAAFLLRETANLALLAGDVEKTAAEARRIADAAHAQTLASDVNHNAASHASATLRLLLAPDTAPGVIAQFKALGRVENFTLQDERVAQNGGDAPDPSAPDAARVERAPVSLTITINHDEQASRQVSLTLVAPDVEAVFDKARAAATAAGGEAVNADVTHPQEGHARATLVVRLPAHTDGPWLDLLKTLGRVGDLSTARGADNAADGPVQVTLTVVDMEAAVQQTSVVVRTAEVERRAAEIKAAATAANAVVESSTFTRQGDGREQAGLSFRLPMAAYPAFVDRVRALGEVIDFTVQRQDRPGDAGAPAEVSLQLYHEGRIVAESSGLSTTLRRTFGQGADALMWSVQMIGVAFAFLAPWAGLLAVACWAVWFVRRRSNRAKKAAENKVN